MPDLLLILFKINLVLLLFATAYYLVLRRLTFYTLNRAFLVSGILFSTIYPFLDLTDFFQRQQQIRPGVTALVPTVDVHALIGNAGVMNYWNLVVILFYTGAACMAIRLGIQFVSLYRIHQHSTPGIVHNAPVRILKGEVSPFSFWQTVYVNPGMHAENELKTILAHEQVHVKEWHTLDIILAEISVVFYWFNPGVWLMKKAIKENIEFITDARMVKKGIDKKAYQYSLLGIGNLENSISLVNHFNLSDLKKRIKMMNARRSSPKKLLLYVLILPVLLTTTLAFTINKKAIGQHLKPFTQVLSAGQLFNDNEKTAVATEREQFVKPLIKNNVKKQKKIALAEKISVVTNVITLRLDSAVHPEMKNIATMVRGVAVPTAMSGLVKGLRLSQTDFPDTVSLDGKQSSHKVVRIVINKGTESSSGEFSEPLLVQGYKNAFKASDSLKLTNVVFMVEGKPISSEEIRQLTAEQIKQITIQRAPGAEGGTIKVTGKKL